MQIYNEHDLASTVLNAPIGICILNSSTLKADVVKDKFPEAVGKRRDSIDKDEGIGIRFENLKKIFERYHRIESKQTQHVSGFGIDLILSAGVIKQHDENLWVESEPGIGSTFYFELPLAYSNDKF